MDFSETRCRSCEFFSGILFSIEQGILITDCEGLVLFANQAAGRIFGSPPPELEGVALSLLITPEDLDHLLPNLLYVGQKGDAFRGEIMLLRKDASRFIAHVSLQPQVDPKSGKRLLFLCIRDVHQQKEIERKLAKNYYPDLVKIADGIAHEIRNPLVGIGGFAQRLFKHCGETPDTHTYFDHLMKNVKKIENLIQKVEFFAKLPKPQMTETSLKGVVETAAAGYGARIEERSIALSLDVEDVEIRMDGGLVSRALSIFIENAMDAVTAGGSIKIVGAADGDHAIIRVVDNGRGISSEDIPYIFNPFFSTKPDGAGIDLAIVKRIAESHGGMVEVSSSLTNGTTFSLRLPIEKRRTIRSRLLGEQAAIPSSDDERFGE